MIQGYLNGKTRDQIAQDVGISQGTVSGIIKEWSTRIGIPIAEEARNFAVTVRKSDISIKECAEGHRMIKLLKSLGIYGETYTHGSNDGKERDVNKEIILFIYGIYLNCKKKGIPPNVVPAWIRDLLDFFPNIQNNNNHRSSLTYTDNGDGQDNHIKNEEPGHQQQQQQQWPNNNKRNIQKLPSENEILFISQVPQYIAQRKKEYRMVVENKQEVIKEIDYLYTIRDKAKQNYRQLHQMEKFALAHIEFFSKLKEELYEGHGIKLENDIQGFAKMIKDFKDHNYDYSTILNEYLTAVSLKLTIKDNESKAKELAKQIASMQISYSH